MRLTHAACVFLPNIISVFFYSPYKVYACEILFGAKSRDKFDIHKKKQRTDPFFSKSSVANGWLDMNKSENIWLYCVYVRCLKPVQYAHTHFSYNEWHFIFRWAARFSGCRRFSIENCLKYEGLIVFRVNWILYTFNTAVFISFPFS